VRGSRQRHAWATAVLPAIQADPRGIDWGQAGPRQQQEPPQSSALRLPLAHHTCAGRAGGAQAGQGRLLGHRAARNAAGPRHHPPPLRRRHHRGAAEVWGAALPLWESGRSRCSSQPQPHCAQTRSLLLTLGGRFYAQSRSSQPARGSLRPKSQLLLLPAG
jgi:hypothetical protein